MTSFITGAGTWAHRTSGTTIPEPLPRTQPPQQTSLSPTIYTTKPTGGVFQIDFNAAKLNIVKYFTNKNIDELKRMNIKFIDHMIGKNGQIVDLINGKIPEGSFICALIIDTAYDIITDVNSLFKKTHYRIQNITVKAVKTGSVDRFKDDFNTRLTQLPYKDTIPP